MSVFIIRNDNVCEEVYNRTTVFCYTNMSRTHLWKYVEDLELLADDRQNFFFKIDFDIFSAPTSVSELKDWHILSIILKAEKRPFSFGILVRLFYEKIPFKLMVDFSSTDLFICSGANNTSDYKPLSYEEQMAFRKLLTHHRYHMDNAVKATERFKKRVRTPEQAPGVIVDLARQFKMRDGHWIVFFNKLNGSKMADVFDIFLHAANQHWGPINRFGVKITTFAELSRLIICIGNETTRCTEDPRLLVSEQEKSVENDPGPLRVKKIIDNIYEQHSELLGFMAIRYKPDIMSACCIQRDNLIKPTVYSEVYGHNTAT